MADEAATSDATSDPPDADHALHARLLAGDDPTAVYDLFEQHLQRLTDWLLRTFPALDPQTLETIAIDSLAKLAQAPEKFDASRRSLAGYLRMDARGDVLNGIQKLKRRQRHEVVAGDVELEALAGNSSWSGAASGLDGLDEVDSELLRAARLKCNDQEWEVLLLMMDSERRTEPFARLLGVQHLSVEEQEREVKRVKDRIKKRVQRLPGWGTRRG